MPESRYFFVASVACGVADALKGCHCRRDERRIKPQKAFFVPKNATFVTTSLVFVTFLEPLQQSSFHRLGLP